MRSNAIAIVAAVPALALGLFLAAASSPVYAQDASPAALPTAPAADRAAQGGLTGAAASLPGPGRGASPLEPYLVTWLLPISGIVAVIAGIYTDRRVRASQR